MTKTAILLVHCPDRRGLVAAIADFLYRHGANILHADQHQDAELSLFLTRIEWDLEGFDLQGAGAFRPEFAELAERFEMDWQLKFSTDRPRVAVFVSKVDHCLVDLLHRHQSGELRCEIPMVVSNHPDNRRITEFYGIPFHSTEVTKENKEEAEATQLRMMADAGIDLVVLARYMQILSPRFVQQYPSRIINIHHSFLPAFLGARPYHRAYQRGVKLIGATSHYVTEVLDEGPIIEQDVARISHRDSVDDLIQKGRDLEKVVLSRAVRWQIESRILLYSGRTVVFD
ncbi:MAG: formyltetrahydrofolate deformylase [Candidatus Eisenbacteria bacterium]|nr:formyltetrahydrofolate deformylase [Candidatus Eisenbacteria bacterium]